MSYKFLEDVAIADVAFIATGKTEEEMFESAALAVTNTMVKDLKSVKNNVTKTIKVEGNDMQTLLFNFLQEIIFLKDAKRLLLNKFNIKISEGKKLKLVAKASGEKLNMKKHELLVDVKAVSMHNFKVVKMKSGWSTSVILDV